MSSSVARAYIPPSVCVCVCVALYDDMTNTTLIRTHTPDRFLRLARVAAYTMLSSLRCLYQPLSLSLSLWPLLLPLDSIFIPQFIIRCMCVATVSQMVFNQYVSTAQVCKLGKKICFQLNLSKRKFCVMIVHLTKIKNLKKL